MKKKATVRFGRRVCTTLLAFTLVLVAALSTVSASFAEEALTDNPSVIPAAVPESDHNSVNEEVSALAADYTFTFSLLDPQATFLGQKYIELANSVFSATGGHVKINVHPGGALANDIEIADKILDGTVDMGIINTVFYPSRFPKFDAFSLPLLFEDNVTSTKVLGRIYQENTAGIRSDVSMYKVLSLYNGPVNYIFTTSSSYENHGIRAVSDLSGLTIRAASSTQRGVVTKWGGTPIAVPRSETYECLRASLISGCLFDWRTVDLFRLDEVVSNVTEIPVNINDTYVVAMNPDAWNRLPAEYQTVIEQIFSSDALAQGLLDDSLQKRESILAKYNTNMASLSNASVSPLDGDGGPPPDGWKPTIPPLTLITPTTQEADTFKAGANAYISEWIAANSGQFASQVLYDRIVALTAAMPANPLDTPVEAFVERLYTEVLGRASDPGKASHVNALTAHAIDGAHAAEGFFFSEEMNNRGLSDEQWIDICYRTFLDRDADADGRQNWLNALDSGASRYFVFSGFVGSDEFSGICASYGIDRGSYASPEARDQSPAVRAFVYRLYTECLGRTPEPDGLNNWCAALLSGQLSGTEAARGFFYSQEFETKYTTNEQIVTAAYKALLGRDPDPAGLADWVSRLDGGASKEVIFHGFGMSPEFQSICDSYGIAQGTIANPGL